MIDDQQQSSDIRLCFYPVLQVISFDLNTNFDRHYDVKLTDGSIVMDCILLVDNPDTFTNDIKLRPFDVITVLRYKNMRPRNGKICIWYILKFSVIDRSHSTIIGKKPDSPSERANPSSIGNKLSPSLDSTSGNKGINMEEINDNPSDLVHHIDDIRHWISTRGYSSVNYDHQSDLTLRRKQSIFALRRIGTLTSSESESMTKEDIRRQGSWKKQNKQYDYFHNASSESMTK